MRYPILLTTLSVFVIGAVPSFADELAKPKSDAELMVEAIVYGAQADAFSAHCGDKGNFSDRFIEKFSSRADATDKVLTYLKNLQNDSFSKMRAALDESGKECKDIEIMMRRLEVMQRLRETSYLLNGVDPSDIPQSPLSEELEQLLLEKENQKQL